MKTDLADRGSEGVPASPTRSRKAQRLGTLVRLACTGAAFAFLFTRIDSADVVASMGRIPLSGLALALTALASSVVAGVVRWNVLLRAYGATNSARWGELGRWYMIATFYNLLPGSVGGDVLRGYATRHFFEAGRATQSLSVVFVERVMGFAGLLMLTAVATASDPVARKEVLLYSSLGLFAAAGVIAALAVGRRFSRYLPSRLAAVVDGLPTIERPRPFIAALALSVLTHVLLSISGYALLVPLAAQVTLADALAYFPLVTLAAFFPLTFAGAGARDTAVVFLFAQVGVARADALACSLALLCCHLLLAGSGGLVPHPSLSASPLAATNPGGTTRLV